MNKRYILLFALLLIAFFQIPVIKSGVVEFFNSVKKNFLSFKNKITTTIEALETNKESLIRLKKENQKLLFELNQLKSFLGKCDDLSYFKQLKMPNLRFSEVVSYVNIPDFTSVYITYNKKITHPLGLVYNNLAAGIAVRNVGDYAVALLNANSKTSYAVYIGKNEIPGIFYGKENIIKYIPKFKQIKNGDLVITSGLDGIFYKGALVGKVVSVKEKKLYQEAKIKVFYNSLNPSFFYIVESDINPISLIK